MTQHDEGQVCALTEQGNFGLGAHKVTDDKEREDLKRRLNEMDQQARQQEQHKRR